METTPTQQPGAADALPRLWVQPEARQNSFSPPGFTASEYEFEGATEYVPAAEVAELQAEVELYKERAKREMQYTRDARNELAELRARVAKLEHENAYLADRLSNYEDVVIPEAP